MFLRQLDILLYPPAINILLLLAGLLLWRRRTLSMTLIVISTLTLLIFSLPVTSHKLALTLEKFPAIDPATLHLHEADAIVVLGGGMVSHADEYNDSSLVDDALVRLRYAAFLQQLTDLPLLATGGPTGVNQISEAETMQRILAEEFRVTNVRAEVSSRTTYENAVHSATILQQHDMHRIFLVTSSLHMNRAVELFRRQGLEVIPAPTNLHSNHDIKWRSYIPSGSAFHDVRHILHEHLGILWYRINR